MWALHSRQPNRCPKLLHSIKLRFPQIELLDELIDKQVGSEISGLKSLICPWGDVALVHPSLNILSLICDAIRRHHRVCHDVLHNAACLGDTFFPQWYPNTVWYRTMYAGKAPQPQRTAGARGKQMQLFLSGSLVHVDGQRNLQFFWNWFREGEDEISRQVYAEQVLHAAEHTHRAYQAERALADLNPGLPVGCSHPHAVLHDGVHGTLLLLFHIPLLSGSKVCTAGKHQSACSLGQKGHVPKCSCQKQHCVLLSHDASVCSRLLCCCLNGGYLLTRDVCFLLRFFLLKTVGNINLQTTNVEEV